MKKFRLLFVGASQFGLNCLESILGLNEVEIVGIISNKNSFTISYNKTGVNNVLFVDFEQIALNYSIPFYRMEENMKEKKLLAFIEKCEANWGLVVGWYHMIPSFLLQKFPFAGLHASLLPNYSGGAPLVWAIINGETKTGITFFLFDKGVDSGDIIGQKEVFIGQKDNIKTLYDKIEVVGIELLKENLPLIANGTVVYTKQDESKRRIFPQRKPEDGLIDWSWDAEKIKNFIRAQTKPYPGAYTIIENKKVTIWNADIEEIK